MPNWQQLGPVKAKVVGDRTLVTACNGTGWGYTVNSPGAFALKPENEPYETEAEAMAAADAIYDPPPSLIGAKDRGSNWSFWKSGDGTRAAWVSPSGRGWDVDINAPRAGKYSGYYETIEAAELAAAKYVGG